MDQFSQLWSQAAYTSLGLFWMAFWAFGLGYLISSMIQVFVTRERMQKAMGHAGAKSVGLATFFGFISSSCSFAALSGTRALFAKGAGLIPSLAFLLSSTNLVIELGIVISVFLGWQFVVAEYLGGLLLILLMWLVVSVTRPKKLIEEARNKAQEKEESHQGQSENPDWQKLMRSKEGWLRVAKKYLMEWKMVWKDVTIGFTLAGIIATFVPKSFFEALFGTSGGQDIGFFELLWQTAVGPVAAFLTFIGSMGNIPLAAVLFENGVSFAGIIAFIFSDLVVFPVLRIHSSYYGWKMALYILGVFLVVLITSAIFLHYGFLLSGELPSHSSQQSLHQRQFFSINYTLMLNSLFILLSISFFAAKKKAQPSRPSQKHHSPKMSSGEKVLFYLAIFCFIWLALGGVMAVVS